MLSRKVSDEHLDVNRHLLPTYASRGLTSSVSRYELSEEGMESDIAYQLIHDELLLDGNPVLNLATFVTTWMDDKADRLIIETSNKNAIDWDEYPQTVEIQDRCVNILARLYNSPNDCHSIGCATVGSSEAIHLAGLAMKWRWKKARLASSKSIDSPNIVMGANVQVCWEKFARYFDVEPRYVPLSDTRFVIGVKEAMELVDENTIGVVGILGSTYTGEYEPIAELDRALSELCEEKGFDTPLHIDAASGGFVAPFIQPDLEWDFRLSRVKSINVSGHKYGLVYPGIGWIIWRDESDLPEELIFEVDYLGGSHANFGLNFSRGASQIIGQYYNFLRFGKQGFSAVIVALSENAKWLANEIRGLGVFKMYGEGTDLPVVCFGVDPSSSLDFDAFALSDALRQRGWIVPAYKMAANAQDVSVLRIVVREGLSRDMAANLVLDIKAAIDHLDTQTLSKNTTVPQEPAKASRDQLKRPSTRVKKSHHSTTSKTSGIC